MSTTNIFSAQVGRFHVEAHAATSDLAGKANNGGSKTILAKADWLVSLEKVDHSMDAYLIGI
jgi:hypothetical protein